MAEQKNKKEFRIDVNGFTISINDKRCYFVQCNHCEFIALDGDKMVVEGLIGQHVIDQFLVLESYALKEKEDSSK